MMNFPLRLHLAGHSILFHSLTELLAMFIGFRYYLFMKKKEGDRLSTQNRLIVLAGAIIGALLGSRLVGAFEDISKLQQAPDLLMYFFENKSIAGGLLGGLFGVEWLKYLIGEKQKSGDLFVFPLLLAMVIGRAGCFSMGVHEATFGKVTPCVFGMDLGDGLLRHPVMLYEIIFLLLLWFLLFLTRKKMMLKPGRLFQLFLFCYLLFRFFVEFLKPNKIYFLYLGTIQIACLAGCLYYSILFLRQSKKCESALRP